MLGSTDAGITSSSGTGERMNGLGLAEPRARWLEPKPMPVLLSEPSEYIPAPLWSPNAAGPQPGRCRHDGEAAVLATRALRNHERIAAMHRRLRLVSLRASSSFDLLSSDSMIGGGATSGTTRRPAFHRAPHALHSCDGPLGPRRHMGVLVLPQAPQLLIEPSGLCVATCRLRFGGLAGVAPPSVWMPFGPITVSPMPSYEKLTSSSRAPALRFTIGRPRHALRANGESILKVVLQALRQQRRRNARQNEASVGHLAVQVDKRVGGLLLELDLLHRQVQQVVPNLWHQELGDVRLELDLGLSLDRLACHRARHASERLPEAFGHSSFDAPCERVDLVLFAQVEVGHPVHVAGSCLMTLLLLFLPPVLALPFFFLPDAADVVSPFLSSAGACASGEAVELAA